MKTLNEQIERLRELVRKCYGAVASKGGDVPYADMMNMETLPSAIGTIPQEVVGADVKIKIPSLGTILTSCIEDNGVWLGERMIDFSILTSLRNLFYSNFSLRKVNFSNLNASNVSDITGIFSHCINVQKIDMQGFICAQNSLQDMCCCCYRLYSLNVIGFDATKVAHAGSAFDNCSSLRTLVNEMSVEDVIANEIAVFVGLKVAVNFSNTILDRASLRAVINGLADLSGESAKTLKLNSALHAKLTQEDIAIATNKNWTIA